MSTEKIDWEEVLKLLPKDTCNSLIVSYPNNLIPQITYSVTNGVEPYFLKSSKEDTLKQLEIFSEEHFKIIYTFQKYLMYKFNGSSVEDRFKARDLKKEIIDFLDSIQD